MISIFLFLSNQLKNIPSIQRFEPVIEENETPSRTTNELVYSNAENFQQNNLNFSITSII